MLYRLAVQKFEQSEIRIANFGKRAAPLFEVVGRSCEIQTPIAEPQNVSKQTQVSLPSNCSSQTFCLFYSSNPEESLKVSPAHEARVLLGFYQTPQSIEGSNLSCGVIGLEGMVEASVGARIEKWWQKVPVQEAQGNMKIIEDGIAHKPATTVPSAGSEKAPLERQLVRAA